MNDFRTEEETTPRGEYKAISGIFGQQGWICPKCGRVYSPFTQMCLYCGKQQTSTSLNTDVRNDKEKTNDEITNGSRFNGTF